MGNVLRSPASVCVGWEDRALFGVGRAVFCARRIQLNFWRRGVMYSGSIWWYDRWSRRAACFETFRVALFPQLRPAPKHERTSTVKVGGASEPTSTVPAISFGSSLFE